MLTHETRLPPNPPRQLGGGLRYPKATAILAIVAFGFATHREAHAVIQILLPLKSVLDDSQTIVVAKVERLDPARPSMVLVTSESLKGGRPFDRLPVNLTGDKERHTPRLLKRIADGTPIVLFIKKESDGKFMALGYTDGTWLQLLGQTDGGQTRWAFTHCETYLRRTYKGTTEELRGLVADVLAGKRKAPPPDPKERPGFGPELAPAAP
ncbi:MAG: hypothetical protein ACKO38_07805 [Planctomycetota bacterium]